MNALLNDLTIKAGRILLPALLIVAVLAILFCFSAAPAPAGDQPDLTDQAAGSDAGGPVLLAGYAWSNFIGTYAYAWSS